MRKNGIRDDHHRDPAFSFFQKQLCDETEPCAALGTMRRLYISPVLPYDWAMQTNNTKRLLKLAQLSEARLKALPKMIRREFRSSANRQVNALLRLERAVDIATKATERQRAALDKANGNRP